MKKTVITLLIVVVLAGMALYYYVNNKPHRNIAKEEIDFKLKATDLFNQFAEKEKVADSLYRNKVIQVEGNVAELDRDQKGDRIIVLKEDDDIFGVSCTTDSTSQEDKQKAESLKIGDYVVLKGFCMGYDSEVKLNKCVVLSVGKPQQSTGE